MTDAELQVIRETLRSIGGACADLAAVVEGLPRIVGERISEFRAEVAAQLAKHAGDVAARTAEVTVALQGMAAQHAELASSMQVLRETFASNIEASAAELRQVIADNRATEGQARTTLEARIADVAEAGVASGTQLGEQLRAAETRHAAEVAGLNTALKSAEQQLAVLLTTKIIEVETRVGAQIVEVETRVGAQIAEISTAVRGSLDLDMESVTTRLDGLSRSIVDLREKIAQPHTHDDLVGAISDAQTAATERAVQIQGRVESVAAVAQQQVDAVAEAARTALEETAGALRGELQAAQAENRTAVEQHAAKIAAVIEQNNTQAAARNVAVDNTVTALTEQLAETSMSIESLSAVVDTHHSESDARIRGVEEQVSTQFCKQAELVVGRSAEFTDGLANLSARLEATDKSVSDLAFDVATKMTSVQKVAEDLGEAVAKNYLETDARICGIEEHVSTQLGEHSTQMADHLATAIESTKGLVVAEVAKAQEKVMGAVNERAAEVEATCSARIAEVRDEINPAVTAMADSLEKRINEEVTGIKLVAPDLSPEQFAELQVRLSAVMPTVELTATPIQPEFDMSFEDGLLAITMQYGEKVQTVQVPVEIGLRYRGVYNGNPSDHKPGDFVSHKGSVWAAAGYPTGEPGKDFTGWRLAVKCGRDGKDARPVRSYAGHTKDRVYRNADFLRVNNRLWQCDVDETSVVPEPGDISSTKEWILIGGVH
jgi:hypothetical protein